MKDPYQPYESYQEIDSYAKKPKKPKPVPEPEFFGMVFMPLMIVLIYWFRRKRG